MVGVIVSGAPFSTRNLDAFYASVEQQLKPRLRGKPIALLLAGTACGRSDDLFVRMWHKSSLSQGGRGRVAIIERPSAVRRILR